MAKDKHSLPEYREPARLASLADRATALRKKTIARCKKDPNLVKRILEISPHLAPYFK